MRVITPSKYQHYVLVAGLSLALIVVTGATVRLTQAGLGCEDWPKCSSDRLVPEWSFHPWVEFGNRLLSGVVSLAVAATVLMAYRRRPRRSDLIYWAWGLVAGVMGQIILGRFTVIIDLHPLLVGAHFLLSIVLLWNAVALWFAAGGGPGRPQLIVDESIARLSRLTVVSGIVLLIVGTLVTGTGPNSGDIRAERLSFDLTAIARIHSISAWIFLALSGFLVWRLQHVAPEAAKAGRQLLAAIVVQGAIGYWQLATGVPPVLVGLHVTVSLVVFVFLLNTHWRLWQRPPLEEAEPRTTDSANSGPQLTSTGT